MNLKEAKMFLMAQVYQFEIIIQESKTDDYMGQKVTIEAIKTILNRNTELEEKISKLDKENKR